MKIPKNIISLCLLGGLAAGNSSAYAEGECDNLEPVNGQDISFIETADGGEQVKFMVKSVETFSFRDREEARDALDDARTYARKKMVEWMKTDLSFDKSIDKASTKRTELSGEQKKIIKNKIKTVSDNVREKGEGYITGALFPGQGIDMDKMESCVTMVWTPALSKIATDVSVNMSSDAEKQIRAKNRADAQKRENQQSSAQSSGQQPMDKGESKSLIGGTNILIQPKSKKGLY